MLDFKKQLFLPSGGLSYSPFAAVKPITNEIHIFSNDKYSSDSILEYQLAIINKYVEHENNILDLYMHDIHYLWFYFLSTDLTNKSSYTLHAKCKVCEEKNTIEVDMGELNVMIYNRYIQKINQYIILELEKVKFIVERRKAKHSIEFANLMFNSDVSIDNGEDYIKYCSLYIATQTKEICVNNKTYNDKFDIYSYITEMTIKDIIKIYEKIIDKENEIGIENNIIFKCAKCGEEQKTLLFNDMLQSLIVPSSSKFSDQDQIELFESFFSLTRLPIMKFEEFLTSPARYSSQMMRAVSKIDFHTGMIIA